MLGGSRDGRGIFGTRIHVYVWLSHFIIHLKLKILLTPTLKYKMKVFNKEQVVGMKKNRKNLQENKKQKSVGKKQESVKRAMGHLFFSKKCVLKYD